MKKVVLWLAALMLLAFLVGIAVVQPFGALRGNSSLPVLAPEPQAPVVVHVQREVILYFGALDSPLLEQETRTIDECAIDQECIMGLIHELTVGPQRYDPAGTLVPNAGHVPVLPPEALLLGVEVVDETARLDFNQALISHHPGGSSSELLTVHALVNTLAANLPHIRRLVLLVDGKPIKTLRGHVDLRQPVLADFSLVQQQSEVATQDGVISPTVDQVSPSLSTRQQPAGTMQINTQNITTGDRIDE